MIRFRAGKRHVAGSVPCSYSETTSPPAATIAPLLLAVARLDALAKGIGTGNAWDELATTGLALAGKTVAPLPA